MLAVLTITILGCDSATKTVKTPESGDSQVIQSQKPDIYLRPVCTVANGDDFAIPICFVNTLDSDFIYSVSESRAMGFNVIIQKNGKEQSRKVQTGPPMIATPPKKPVLSKGNILLTSLRLSNYRLEKGTYDVNISFSEYKGSDTNINYNTTPAQLKLSLILVVE
jgi:hypothetical protein